MNALRFPLDFGLSKKLIAFRTSPTLLCLGLAVLPLLAGCQEGAVVEIKEKMFIAQTNDVYLNAEDYLGKTFKLEGIFKADHYGGDLPHYFVIRYGPGCCGSDGNAGFEVHWDKPDQTYPKENDWVEAIGTLSSYEEDGYPYLYINLSSLTPLKTRGAEFVNQ